MIAIVRINPKQCGKSNQQVLKEVADELRDCGFDERQIAVIIERRRKILKALEVSGSRIPYREEA